MKFGTTFLVGLLVAAVLGTGFIRGAALKALGEDERPLREACIKATLRAIEMEIKNYEQKSDAAQNDSGNDSNMAVFNKRIAELKTELEKYRAMNPDRFQIPEKKIVTVLVNEPYQEGAILELENMTKSGPFYHLAGIRGDDYDALKPPQKYIVTVYLVYKRDYVLPLAANYYVYVDFRVSYSLGPRQTGEEILEELIIKGNTVSVRVGSNGCTDKRSFRVDVKKEEGITKKTPHYVLTFYRIKPDECKAIVEEGVVITFDLEKDLGLSGVYTISIANRVLKRADE